MKIQKVFIKVKLNDANFPEAINFSRKILNKREIYTII